MATEKKYRDIPDLEIENAHIFFKNFAGSARTFNDEGERNFCVEIEDADQAQMLAEDGWKVKVLAPREEGERPMHYIPVKVSFDSYPPRVFLFSSSRKRTLLTSETIECLDYADIERIDLVINPYQWFKGNNSGVKAYLKAAYVTIKEDRFAAKYAEY